MGSFLETENWERTNAPDIVTFHPSRITPRLAARAVLTVGELESGTSRMLPLLR